MEREVLKSSLTKIVEELKKNPTFNTGIIRVHTKLLENVKQEAVVGGYGMGYEKSHKFIADERPLLGGGDEGPAPLEYFIAGLNFCLQSTFVHWSTMLDVPIEALEMETKAYWNRRGSYVEGDPSFTKIVFEFNVKSSADENRVKEAVETAEKHCVVHATLRKAVNMESQIMLNGRRLR